MESNWATEHLQVIRTLMERSAVYRRALAPITLYCGALGIAGGTAGALFQIYSARGFVLFWCVVATVALIGSFLLMRRQALKDAEPFWSPPTRRVAAAMIPALFFGAFVAALMCWANEKGLPQALLPPLWMALYGCSLHAAGFFMPRGIRLFAWAFILFACCKTILLFVDVFVCNSTPLNSGHMAMGVSFGLLHLVYGIYLYFTEKRGNET